MNDAHLLDEAYLQEAERMAYNCLACLFEELDCSLQQDFRARAIAISDAYWNSSRDHHLNGWHPRDSVSAAGPSLQQVERMAYNCLGCLFEQLDYCLQQDFRARAVTIADAYWNSSTDHHSRTG